MRALQEGLHVWLPNPSTGEYDHPFALASVVEAGDETVRVKMLNSKGMFNTSMRMHVSALDVANKEMTIEGEVEKAEPDNVNLLELSEATLLHNTLLRYEEDKIYTFTGPIVTSVNPCKPLPRLYTVEAMQAARVQEETQEHVPHIFSVGQTAYANLTEKRRNQSIVVTGVSGAGKTEANKYLLRFLCWRAAVGEDGVGEVELPETAQAVLQSTPVFESFGNATTVNNLNSSRFGKFTKLYFDELGVAGASVDTYLLEKSRLAQQQEGEANFHIFYQMLAGSSDETLTALKLCRNYKQYNYLSGAGKGPPSREPMHDEAEFGVTHKAMQNLGLRPDEVFRVLAGLLHLGNINFEVENVKDADRGSHVAHESLVDVHMAEELLGIKHLEHRLTAHMVQAGGGRLSFYEVRETPEEAARSRDALAKRLYERVFGWLVGAMNSAIGSRGARSAASGEAHWIGLLDIFGFEIFRANSLEQLLINLANEKLQRFFLDTIFRHEQALYAREEIAWVKVDVPDNEAIMAAIEEKPHGLLSILDEQCRLGERGTDLSLCIQLNQKNSLCAQHVAGLDQKRKAKYNPETTFTLAHFVAPVDYTAAGFLEKNRDTLYVELAQALTQSTQPLMQELFPEKEIDAASLRCKGSGKSYATVANVFLESLSSLLSELSETDAGFVRTIKPNHALKPQAANARLVLGQLRTCGMLQAVKMIRSMFPSRTVHDDVVARYRAALRCDFMNELSPRDFVTAFCGAFDVPPEQ